LTDASGRLPLRARGVALGRTPAGTHRDRLERGELLRQLVVERCCCQWA
jgi:hypothetical protein